MSFFRREKDDVSGSGAGAPVEDSIAYKQAILQLDMTTQGFGLLTNGCFKKCISKFKDADLSVAEMSCVDRCVTKFIAATNTSGMVMRQQQEQMMALMQGQQPQ